MSPVVLAKIGKKNKGEAAFKIVEWSLKYEKYSPTKEENAEAERRLEELNEIMGKAKFKELMTSMGFEISEKIRDNPVAKLLYILGNSNYGRSKDYDFAFSIKEYPPDEKSKKEKKVEPKKEEKIKEQKKKTKEKPLEIKPVKIAHHTTPAGTLLKGEAGLLVNPLNLEIDLGMGGIFFNNLDSGQFFFSPAISGTHGGDFSFSWLYSAGMMLEGKTKPIKTKGHSVDITKDPNLGTVEMEVSPTESKTKVKFDKQFYHMLYLAFTYNINISDNAGLTLLIGSGGLLGHDKQGNVMGGHFGSDVAISVDAVAVSLYDIISMTWGVPEATKQHITDLQPFFQQNVIGVHGSLPKGHGIYAEWTHDVFFDELVLGGEFLTKMGEISIAVSGKKESKMMGKGYSFGIKVDIPIEVNSTTYADISSEVEFGMEDYHLVEYDVLDLRPYTTNKVLMQAPAHILEDEAAVSEAEETMMDNFFSYSSFDGQTARQEAYDKEFPEYAYVGDAVLNALEVSETFDEFTEYLSGMNMSTEDYILTAATISDIGKLHYSDEMIDASRLSDKWEEWSGMSYNDVYVEFRDGLSKGEKLDAGICAHLNGMAVEFLNKNGIEAYGVSIPMPDGLHHIAFAVDNKTNKSYLIDYGDVYQAEGTMLDLLRTYAGLKGVQIDSIYLYGKQGEFIGLYTTPEGELIQEAISPIGKTKKEYLKGLLKSKIKKVK